jgi:hypothetical protein
MKEKEQNGSLWPTLTDDELARMKHALGFNNKDAKDGVFEAYRRCSCYDEVHETWEGLVAKGYAKHSPCGVGWYVVTESGMQAVANATGLIIRFELEFEPKK